MRKLPFPFPYHANVCIDDPIGNDTLYMAATVSAILWLWNNEYRLEYIYM